MSRTATRRSFPLFGTAALALAFALPGACGASQRISWGGSVSAGNSWNLLQSSRSEEQAFRSGSPGYWFEIDRLNDGVAEAGLWVKTDFPSLYKTVRVKLAYERAQPFHNPIVASDAISLSLRQKLPGGSSVALDLAARPQVYLRHRVDKDAPPGAPRFRPEAYRGTEAELSFTRPLRRIPVTLSAGVEKRDESRWFNERDRVRTVGGCAAELAPRAWLRLTPSYAYGVTRSRNVPDLGSDFSHREHEFGLRAHADLRLPAGPWGAEGAGAVKLRRYTTRNPEDSSRYGRRDTGWWGNVRVDRSFGRWAPFAVFEWSGRQVALPAGSDASDEDGEYDGALLRTGIEWEF